METTKSARLLQLVREALGRRAAEVEEEEGADSGFTLIELMVVLLIIAILLAIAIPTFLGVTNSANDRAAQSNLTNAVIAADSVFQQTGQTYSSANFTTDLNGQVGGVSFTTGNSGGQNTISYAVSGNGQELLMAVYSAPTNTCWYAESNQSQGPDTGTGGFGTNVSTGTWYAIGKSAGSSTGSPPANCTAATTNVNTGVGWSSSYPQGVA